MSKVQFSWNNQKGYGLVLLFFGWSLIMQIPAFYYNYLVIRVPASDNDWLIFAGTIVFVTAILGSLISSIFENMFDPFDQTLVNAHTVVLLSFLVFYIFYIFSVPLIREVEPFLSLPTKVLIFGWGEYMISLVSGIIGMTIFWYTTEYYLRLKNRVSKS